MEAIIAVPDKYTVSDLVKELIRFLDKYNIEYEVINHEELGFLSSLKYMNLVLVDPFYAEIEMNGLLHQLLKCRDNHFDIAIIIDSAKELSLNSEYLERLNTILGLFGLPAAIARSGNIFSIEFNSSNYLPKDIAGKRLILEKEYVSFLMGPRSNENNVLVTINKKPAIFIEKDSDKIGFISNISNEITLYIVMKLFFNKKITLNLNKSVLKEPSETKHEKEFRRLKDISAKYGFLFGFIDGLLMLFDLYFIVMVNIFMAFVLLFIILPAVYFMGIEFLVRKEITMLSSYNKAFASGFSLGSFGVFLIIASL